MSEKLIDKLESRQLDVLNTGLPHMTISHDEFSELAATIATQAAQIEALTKAVEATRLWLMASGVKHPEHVATAIDAALSNTGKK